MKKYLLMVSSVIGLFGLFNIASAHEAYVLPKGFFWNELGKPFSAYAINALKDPHNLRLTIEIIIGVLLLLTINFFIRESSFGEKVEKTFEKLAPLGPLFVRAAIAIAFFYSAYSWSFLGPELALREMPFPTVIRALLFVVSIMVAVGFFTEAAGFISLVVFSIGFAVFGLYLMTYLNYLGEIIVLFLFGMRKWSFDRYLFGPKMLLEKWAKYETTIVRIFYGVALAYAAITVKFLHPELTIKVVNDWNLTQFHWLFPSDPLLVVLGAGLAELAIGIFIIFGFEMRLTVIISLFYITLSLLFFRELVWPHLMLYGISLNLIVQPEIFTIDHLIFEEKRLQFWKRPLLPHRA